jgi:hypothetical protein
MSARRPHHARIPAPAYLISLAAFLALPQYLFAAPDPCVPNPENGELDCQGDQSAGIELTVPPAASTLRVDALTQPIAPASGDGIRYTSPSGSDLTLISGQPGQRVEIETAGNDARGIFLQSVGQPPAPPLDALLDVSIPGAPGVSGGVPARLQPQRHHHPRHRCPRHLRPQQHHRLSAIHDRRTECLRRRNQANHLQR